MTNMKGLSLLYDFIRNELVLFGQHSHEHGHFNLFCCLMNERNSNYYIHSSEGNTIIHYNNLVVYE